MAATGENFPQQKSRPVPSAHIFATNGCGTLGEEDGRQQFKCISLWDLVELAEVR